jgi:hypothetical protein
MMTATDTDFLTDAERLHLEASATEGVAVRALLTRILSAPPAVKRRHCWQLTRRPIRRATLKNPGWPGHPSRHRSQRVEDHRRRAGGQGVRAQERNDMRFRLPRRRRQSSPDRLRLTAREVITYMIREIGGWT